MERLKETLENLSKTVFEKQFRLDYEKLSKEAREKVANSIEELATQYLTEPWNHPQVKYIPSQGEIWRLKVGNQGQETDHRIFFDITDEGLTFLTISHRDTAYQPQK